MMFGKKKEKSRLDAYDDSQSTDDPGVQVVAVVARPVAKELIDAFAAANRDFTISKMEAIQLSPAMLMTTDLLLVECRIVEGYEDLGIIRTARQLRTLMPIVVLGANSDPTFILAAFEAGANDYIAIEVNPEVLGARLRAIAKMARSARLMEAQNDELVRSLKTVRREMGEREKAEAERKIAQENAYESAKLASLGEMAGGIAHEIKTPLAVIMGGLSILREMLASGNVSGDALTTLVDVEKMTDRVSAIIRGLKTFSRNAESDPFEKTLMSDIVNDTLAICDEVILREGIKLDVSVPSDLSFACQPTQISQVLLNLLANAKHAVEKLSERWITVEAVDRGDTVELAVTDSGPGISQELREKVFLPFFTTKEKGVGTGLGLSISSKIAAAHGGRLMLDDNCRNTRFILTVAKQH